MVYMHKYKHKTNNKNILSSECVGGFRRQGIILRPVGLSVCREATPQLACILALQNHGHLAGPDWRRPPPDQPPAGGWSGGGRRQSGPAKCPWFCNARIQASCGVASRQTDRPTGRRIIPWRLKPPTHSDDNMFLLFVLCLYLCI